NGSPSTSGSIGGRGRSRCRRRLPIVRLWYGRQRRRTEPPASLRRERIRLWPVRRRAGAVHLFRRRPRWRHNFGTRCGAWPARRRRDSSSRWRRRRQRSWRARQMRRVGDGGRRRGEACARTWKYAAHEHGDRRLAAECGACLECYSCFTSQGEDGIELYGAADGGGASGKGHDDGDGQDDREEHGLDGNLRVEDGAADLAGEQRSGGESGNAADEREEECFRKEDRRDREIACAEGFHQTDFDAPLIDGRGHGGGNGEGGCVKGGERDQQHESLDAREHGTFVLRDLADLLSVRMRDDFLQLVGN